MRLRILFCVALLGAGALLAGTQTAQARVRLCNETSHVLRVATAHQIKSVSKSAGWITLIPGSCAYSLEGMPRGATAFVHAKSDPAHRGDGLLFGGTHRFCVDGVAPNFAIEGRLACRRRGFGVANFSPIDTSGRRPLVSFKAIENFRLKRASAAGVQRLLTDLGYSPGRIDGFGGGETDRAIAAFRRDNRLPAMSQRRLMQRLLRVARSDQKNRGLTLCNRTPHLVWAATGIVKRDDFETRGWLKLPAKTCRKAIANALEDRFYFAYAEAVTAKGVPVIEAGKRKLWAGNFQMCAKPTSFVVEGATRCAERGLDSLGFRKIDTGKKHKWQVEFE